MASGRVNPSVNSSPRRWCGTHPQRVRRPLGSVFRLPGLHAQLRLGVRQLRLGDLPEAQDFVLATSRVGAHKSGLPSQHSVHARFSSPLHAEKRPPTVAPSPAAHSCAAARQQPPCPAPPSALAPAGWRPQLPAPPWRPAWWATSRALTWCQVRWAEQVALGRSACTCEGQSPGSSSHVIAASAGRRTTIVHRYTALWPSRCLLARHAAGGLGVSLLDRCPGPWLGAQHTCSSCVRK